ncbi:MAG: fumarylacetoacetate hydrolase family protein [Alphaproteobacteria bacterium]|nr:fumarylacetoacetate hydrolase family protein [Alphaproteobacteria bacterium]
MRFVALRQGKKDILAVRRDGDLIDLAIAAPKLPRDLAGLLAAGPGAMKEAARAVAKAKGRALVKGRYTYLPPIPRPGKIICVGLNYHEHASESPYEAPKEKPVFFNRFAQSFVGHKQALIRPRVSKEFDYEGEMVAVIGRHCRHVSRSRALGVVAGYSIFNEGSIRDYQLRPPARQWLVGKTFEASGSFGPEFVTADELPKGANGLRIQTRLSGDVVQDANTNQMIFDVATLVAELTEIMSLEPGDVIVTGTPAGVGFARKPPLFMKPGDICEIEVEGIGVLSNPVKAEK